MHARPKVRTVSLRALGAGLVLWSGAAAGCAGAPTVAEPAVTLPSAPRNVLNMGDLALPTERVGGALSPARPVIRTAMRRALTSAAFSADSQRLFAVSSHGELVAYDVATGALRGYARPWFDGTYPQLQVDRSGSRVLVVAPGRAPVLWDLRSDTLRTLPTRHDGSQSTRFALHPAGDRYVTVSGTDDGLVLTQTRFEDGSSQQAPVDGAWATVDPSFLEYSPSGARIALLASAGTTFTLVDTSDLHVVRTDRIENAPDEYDPAGNGPGPELVAAFRPAGGQLALARPGRIELLDSETGRVRAEVRLGGETTARLSYSADGRWLVANSLERVVVMEAQTGEVTARLSLPTGDGDPSEADYRLYALPGAGGFLALAPWDETSAYDARGVAQEVAFEAGELASGLLRYSPDAQWRFVPAETPEFHRVGESEPRSTFVAEGSQVSVWGADFSVDGRVLFTRTRAGVSRFAADGMRDLSCGNEAPTRRAADGSLAQLGGYASCLFDRDRAVDGSSVVTADGSTSATFEDGEFVVRRSGAARPVRLVRSRSSRVTCEDPTICMRIAQLAPDGSAIAFSDAQRSEGTREVWWEVYDSRTGRLRANGTRAGGYFRLALLAGGAFYVEGENSFVLHDARGRARITLESVFSHTASADGALVAVQTQDHTVHVIDVATQREVETWSSAGQLSLMRVTPDHQRIVALANGVVLVTSLDGSTEHAVPLGEEPFVSNAAGTYALACEDGRAVRVDVRTGERVDVTRCEGRPDAISEDGALAVMTVGSSTRVHRLSDGRVLTLETLADAPSLRVAYDSAGRWDVSEADPARVLIRAAGPGETAPLLSPAQGATPGLFGLFVTGQ